MQADPDYVPHRDRSATPWALIIAIVILIGFELFLRASGWPKKIPYQLDEDEYFAVNAAIEKYPVPDIAIIGSSRAREGFDLPLFRDRLDKAVGKNLTVRNYAVAGGRTYVINAITQKLLRQDKLPKVIIFGGAERDLGTDETFGDEAPIYWNFTDWKQAWHDRGNAVLNDLPTVIRNELGNFYLTLRYREQLNLKLCQIAEGDKDYPGPLDGDLTPWQRTYQQAKPANKPTIVRLHPSRESVAAYARSTSRQPYPNPELWKALDRLAETCEQKHVQLVLFQVPIPAILQQAMPPGVEAAYRAEAVRVCQQHNATFIPAEDLKLDLADLQFRDTSHLNLSGADRLSEQLAAKIAQLHVNW